MNKPIFKQKLILRKDERAGLKKLLEKIESRRVAATQTKRHCAECRLEPALMPLCDEA